LKCGRRGCERDGEKRHSATTSYCRRCYRVMKILDYCHRKYPERLTTWDEVASLWDGAIATGQCPHCFNLMVLYSDGRRRTGLATIQHYDDGRLGIICFTCNLAHSKSELRDKLFNLPQGQKFCPDCQTAKPKYEFHITRRDLNGHVTYCKPCQNTRNRAVKQRRRVQPSPFITTQAN
jgi:hypothetical protein